MPELSLQPLLPPEEGGSLGKITVADFPYTIGRRRDCGLRISNACVSRVHCRLIARAGGVCVDDLESLNGTFVNEERVRQPRPLADGDTLRVAFMVFKVHAPALAAEKTIVQTESVGSRAGGGRDVLVVEDDANAAASLALVLKAWGYKVRVAHDGPEALRAARDHRPDSVLLDVGLPGMDGFQVARRLRKEVGLADARMVAMTGRLDAVNRNPDDTGIDKVLIKPVGPEALREVIGSR